MVVITGVLSMLAMVGFQRHMQQARGGEAIAVIQAIRGAQESYMAENKAYLNVSATSGGVQWYPRLVPNKAVSAWSNSSHPDYLRWRQLAPSVNAKVMFSYLTNAGVPGTKMPALQVAAPTPTTVQPSDWYVIQASGDVDGDGTRFWRYVASSTNGELFIENEGE